MTTDERLRLILTHARADLQANRDAPRPERGQGAGGYFELQAAIAGWRRRRELAEQGVVELRLSAWLGRSPTHSETTLFSRAYERGEARGLWERITESGKTKALRLIEDTG